MESDEGESCCAKSTISTISSSVGSSQGRPKGWKRGLWGEFCKDMENASWIAPVSYFKHTQAPFATNWDEVGKIGLVMEVPNPYTVGENLLELRWWFAEVVGFAGYRAYVRFENGNGDGNPENHTYTWVPFCSDMPKHIGFSEQWSLPLVPVSENLSTVNQATLAEMQMNLQSKATLPQDHYRRVCAELQAKSGRFAINEIVEAMNNKDCSQYRLAQVLAIIGDRVHVLYCDRANIADDEGFWFSQNSSQIQPLGFCRTVGMKLHGTDLHQENFPTLDATQFPKTPANVKIEIGMLFEMRHPCIPHKIVAGYVVQPLKHGYFVAGTDWTRKEELVEITMHVTSDYLLPLNFCRDHGIKMLPPVNGINKNNEFSWQNYLKKFSSKALDLSGVERLSNPFTKGCKLEAIDITSPFHLRPATVTQTAGHLMKIHFDGKSRADPTTFQWTSCSSSNIYPAGYAEMVCHPIRGHPAKPLLIDKIARSRPSK